MEKHKSKLVKKETGLDLRISEETVQEAGGSKYQSFNWHLIAQTAKTIFTKGMDEETQIQAIRSAIIALKGIGPRSEIEGLLATQMVATHNAAMECLRRAMVPGQTLEVRDQNLKHAAKLLGIYTRQIETLDKHRGKGRQKITVEHVNVHKGGQAIVGNVETNASGISETQPVSKALENNPDPVMPTADFNTAPKRKTAEKVRSRSG